VQRQRLKDKRDEIADTIRNLRFKSDTFSQREYEERLALLETKFRQLEQDLSAQPADLEEVLGLSRAHRRHFRNLADFTSETRQDLLREQEEAAEFVKRLQKDKQEHRSHIELLERKRLDLQRQVEEKEQREREAQLQRLQQQKAE